MISRESARLRVSHVVPTFHPAHVHGGPAESVFQLCRHLVDSDCDVRVLTTDSNGPDATLSVPTDREVEPAPGLRVRYCRRRWAMTVSPALVRALPSFVDWGDVVHLTAVYSFPVPPSLLLSKLGGKPVVWSPRGALQRWEGSRRPGAKAVWDAVCRALSPDRLCFHVTSEEEGRATAERFPRHRVVTIPNGVAIPESFVRPSRESSLRILFLGRLDPKKGIENLFGACRILKERAVLPWSLLVAGEGDPRYERTLRALAEEMRVATEVRFVGPAYGRAKQEVFDASDVVVVPSHTENFGMVVAEALASEVPVIASTATPWPGLATEECGLHVPNSPESLAAAIERAATMPLREMGRRGRRWMERDFGWSAIAARMRDLYREIRATPDRR